MNKGNGTIKGGCGEMMGGSLDTSDAGRVNIYLRSRDAPYGVTAARGKLPKSEWLPPPREFHRNPK